jgi:hypothetical protein
MHKKIKIEKYDTLEIILPDGVRLTIYDDNGDIDIKTMYCGIKVSPCASNHIIIEKDDIKIPKHNNKDLKKCSKCGNEKEGNEFYKNSKTVCIECQNKKRRSNFLPFSEMIKKDIKI